MARPATDHPTPDAAVFGAAHAAQFFGCDPATLRNYATRGIVSPPTSSSGRRMWRMEDLLAIAAYRRARGLSDGGALLQSDEDRQFSEYAAKTAPSRRQAKR
jgi:DNA-binding transcriptional MerR regulator